MKSWYEIYSDRMNQRYRDHIAAKYAPFLKALHQVNASSTTEIGCGAGNITRILREMRWNKDETRTYHLIDSCPRMLGLAVENNPDHRCRFVCADVTMVAQNSQLVHSHGLLEHFDDLTIKAIVEMNFEVSPLQLHYVPGAKYEKPSRGDERLLTPDRWKHMLRKYGAEVSTFNDDFDIIIRIER